MTREQLNEMLIGELRGKDKPLGVVVYDLIDYHWGISSKLAKRGLDCRDDDRLMNDFLNAAVEEINEYERIKKQKI
jgi:hypothetical protein